MEKLLYNIGQVLGVTIIHSLWQGLLVYAALHLLFVCQPALTPAKKYFLSLGALLSILLGFICTFYIEAQSISWNPETQKFVPVISASAKLVNTNFLSDYPINILNLPLQHASFEDYKAAFYYTLKNYLPYISVLYIIGFIINLCGLWLAWNKVRTIKQTLAPAPSLQSLVNNLSKRLHIYKPVSIGISDGVDVACIVGYIKPILLLPVSFTTHLSAAEVEAILLHELSHIRNNDYLLNLIQQFIIALLFFNPFTHLINRIISKERENRCDDMVIKITGNPLTYAQALLKLEENRYADLKLALAATSKKYHLLNRVERMMKSPKPMRNARPSLLSMLLFIALIFVFFSLKAMPKTGFTLSGKITGAASGTYASLNYLNSEGKPVHDTCLLKNGIFKFKGEVSAPTLAFLSAYKGHYKMIEDSDPNGTDLFIEPGNITVSANYGHLNLLKTAGSKTQKEYEAYHALYTPLAKLSDPIEARYISVNHEYINAAKQHKGDKVLDSLNKIAVNIREQLSPFRHQYKAIARQYIAAHPNSYISAMEVGFYTDELPLDTMKAIYNKFNPFIQHSTFGLRVHQAIIAMGKNAVGNEAVNFTSADLSGKPLSLAEFKGHYVLLNFWISTEPILNNAPHLIQLYKKYHQAGLEVISIADNDFDTAAWKHAIQKNETGMWYNILRGLKRGKNGYDVTNSIDDKFDVTAAPTRILIDYTGRIAGRYEGTEQLAALDKKLAEIYR